MKATDIAGQWSTKGVTWTPYSVPPTVTITSKPAASSSNSAPSFGFTSNISSPGFECSLELASASTVLAPCTSPKSYSGKAAGTYKFTVRATDPSGSWVQSTYQFTITVPSGDTQTPSTPGTPIVVIVPAGGSIGADSGSPASGIPLQVTWTPATDNVAVAGYQLLYSTNSGAYINAGNTSGNSVTMTVPPGTNTWRFQVRAYDAAGNFSAPSAASTAVIVGIQQEAATSTLTYTGTWTNSSSSDSSGGSTRYATATSAAATFKPATGTNQVAVVMATGPSAGRATITVDGGTATTVELYAATAGQRRVILSTTTLSATSAHTIVIKPAGTKHSSSSSTRIDVDAFVTRR